MERSDEFFVGSKRTVDSASLDVGQALSELSIDDAALLGRVLVVRSRKFGIDADDAPETLNAIFWPLLRPA